jgi:hypothetical protein
MTVAKILEDNGYSKQTNKNMLQVGEPESKRNKQFEYINLIAQEYIDQGESVMSVDIQKKEHIGHIKNNRLKKALHKVLDHDFSLEEVGKISPYGVYHVNKNIGFVHVGTSHDTSEFVVASISHWWETVGKQTYPPAASLSITGD